MTLVELLTVEASFRITGRGVVVKPNFSVPNGWRNRTETIVVLNPNGGQYEASAQFNLEHFNIADPSVSIDQRWRVVVMLMDRTSERRSSRRQQDSGFAGRHQVVAR